MILLAILLALAGIGLLVVANRRDTHLREQPAVPDESAESAEPAAEDVEEQPDPLADEPTEGIPLAPEEPEPEPEPTPEPKTEPEPENPKASPKLKNRFPLGLRRERKAWAEERGWGFRKTDDYLVDEWSRGAAATGAAPRNIAVGEAFGHETLLMDLGGTNVMAMRTGALASVVVDMRRRGIVQEDVSDDLFEVKTIGDFDVFATDTGATERMLDERVDSALINMPERVVAAWLEGDWALAQTTKDARGETWDAMLAPLALLADAARVLPPRDAVPLRSHDVDPSRDIPEPEPTGAQLTVVDDEPADEFSNPPVQRPETPVVYPSRKGGEAFGAVEARPLGADEVGAIADGEETPEPHLPRELEIDPELAAERARLDRQLGRHRDSDR